MTKRVDAYSRHHVEAMGRLFGLLLVGLVLFAVLQVGMVASNSEVGAKWDAGEMSLDVSVGERKRHLDEVLERLNVVQTHMR